MEKANLYVRAYIEGKGKGIKHHSMLADAGIGCKIMYSTFADDTEVTYLFKI